MINLGDRGELANKDHKLTDGWIHQQNEMLIYLLFVPVSMVSNMVSEFGSMNWKAMKGEADWFCMCE